jgi:hypothetical protein
MLLRNRVSALSLHSIVFRNYKSKSSLQYQQMGHLRQIHESPSALVKLSQTIQMQPQKLQLEKVARSLELQRSHQINVGDVQLQ